MLRAVSFVVVVVVVLRSHLKLCLAVLYLCQFCIVTEPPHM